MRAYYNDNERFVCRWLRGLVADGSLPPGNVDERPIESVSAADLVGYDQCHFFAGIGGWPLALSMAGWPDEVPVWTGSCPCQPLSGAGLRRGHADKRHLWPAFYALIAECRPPIVFGEQVASADGREWLAAVRADLEALGYAVGAADLCAAGVGAPHVRQRLYWVAHSATLGMEDPDGSRFAHEDKRGGFEAPGEKTHSGPSQGNYWSNCQWAECADGYLRPIEPGVLPLVDGFPGRVGQIAGYGNAVVPQVAAEFVMAAMEVLRL